MPTLAGGRVRGGGAEPNKTTAKNAGLFQYNPSTTSTNYFIRAFYQKSGRNYAGFTEQMQNFISLLVIQWHVLYNNTAQNILLLLRN